MTNHFRVNLIVVLNQSKTHVLMCHRQKDPYYLKYNFVGGKVEANETSLEGAYRELFEETNISSNDIDISPLFSTFYYDDLVLEVFSGILNKTVEIIEEANPLKWICLDENFLSDKYAGDGNIQHIVECVRNKHSLYDEMNK